MIKIYFTLVLAILVSNLFSQQHLVLKNFKYRIDTYRAINYSLNSGARLNSASFQSGNNKNSSASGAGGVSYYTIKSTDNILFTATGGINSSLYTGKTERPNEVNTSQHFNVTPQINVLNKWYNKNRFTELGLNVSANYRSSKEVGNNYPGPAKNKQGEYFIFFNTGIGTGRLENITDMQNALWLYKDLESEKLLSRSLSDEELNDLGRAITRGNNTRVLDSRRRTQFILKTVDAYLQQKSVVNKTDINYFVHLNDILFFAFNNPRLSGTEKFIRFTPGLFSYTDDATQNDLVNKYQVRYNTPSLALSTGINKYLPISLKQQQNYGASIRLSYLSRKLTDRRFNSGVLSYETKTNTEVKEAALNVFFEHAIYPNTRTVISFNLKSCGGYHTIAQQSEWFADVNLSASLNYFISYRTRFTCNAGTFYEKNKLYPERLQLFANAGLEINL